MSKRNRMRLVPKTKQSVSLKTKIALSVVGAGLILAAVLLTKGGFSGIYNGNSIVINDRVAHRYNNNFMNGDKGTLIVSGILKFRADLINKGGINCGDCNSGASHFDNPGHQQLIEGPQEILFHDIVFNNPSGINLKGPLTAHNSVTFSKGIISGSYTDPGFILHFLNNAAHTSGTDTSHVDGYVSKQGAGQFDFPVGDGTEYGPVGITGGSSATEVFKAAYFPGNPSVATAPSGAPFDVLLHETIIENVNSTEYWDVDGDASTQIVLHWKPSHNFNVFADQPDNLVVAGWDGTQWVSLGNSNITGSLNLSGTVTSTLITPNDYEAFTFAKIDLLALPVEWMSFTGEIIENYVSLEWATVWETNTHQFDVERSADATFFQKIGQVKAAGSSQDPSFYQFPDKAPFPNGNSSMYYRLRQVDLNGNYTYSNIIQVNFRDILVPNKLKVFPNPTQEGITVRYQVFEQFPATLTVTSMTGQTVAKEQVTGSGDLKVMTNNWTSGTYAVSLISENQQAVSKMVILLD